MRTALILGSTAGLPDQKKQPAARPSYTVPPAGQRLKRRASHPEPRKPLGGRRKPRRSGARTLRRRGKLPRGAQVVPVQVEALLRGYFNSWAMYGLQLSDAVFFDDAPDIPVDRYPVARRFFERSPLRRTKYIQEFYEMLNLATKARATMREMDRTYRPQYADELEQTRENLEYRQLTAANREMRGIVREINSVMRAPDLATLHELAKDMAHNSSYRLTINRLRHTKDWRDLGALKAELLDLTIMERNKHAKAVVQDIEAQRKEAAR